MIEKKKVKNSTYTGESIGTKVLAAYACLEKKQSGSP